MPVPRQGRRTVEGEGVGALRTLTSADGSAIVERLETLDAASQRLSYALLTDTPFRNCLTTMLVRDLGSNQAELTWSASFQPDGLPASEAVDLLEGALAEDCFALKQCMEAQDTIGGYTLPYAEGCATGHSEVTPTEWGFSTLNSIGRRGGGFRLDWYRPNLSVLHFGYADESNLHVFSIPVSGNHTRVMTVRRLPEGTDAIAWSHRNAGVDSPILSEDRGVVESQVGEVPDDDLEISVGADAPSIAFRRWYYRDLKRRATTATRGLAPNCSDPVPGGDSRRLSPQSPFVQTP